MKETIKKWYKSKTIRANIIIIIFGIVTWMIGQYEAGISISIIGIINTVLRIISEKKIVF